MRSLSRSTSSSSAETKSTETPSSQSDSTSRCTSVFAPTSMPRVGSSRIRSLGSVRSHRASSTFCWLPPLSVPTTRFGSAGRMSSAAIHFADQLVLAPAGDRSCPPTAGLQREDDVLAGRQLVDETFCPAVLRAERDLPRSRRAWAANRHRLAVDVEPPGVGPVGAEQEPRDLRAPRAEEACEADDLARVDGQVERRDRALASDRLRLDDRRGLLPLAALAAGVPLELVERLELPPEHLRDELRPRELGRRPLAHEQAVAQDRDAVCDLVHLLEEVRDEHDRDPPLLEPADQREELRDLVLVEARGRLVEDEHVRGDVDRAGDRDHLLDRERLSSERRTDVDVDADPRERLGRPPPHGAPLDVPEPAWLASDRDVLGDGEVRAEVDLLVDGAHAGPLRLERVGELDPLPVELDLAGVREVDAGQDLHERALAGAVLAHQRMDLAGEQAEVDRVQRPGVTEQLVDATHLEDWCAHGVRCPATLPGDEEGNHPR